MPADAFSRRLLAKRIGRAVDWIHRREAKRATPALDVTLRNAKRERRYLLRPDAPGYFLGEVWFDRARHRRQRVAGVHDANLLRDQFLRELRDLLADGWTEADGKTR